MIIAESRMRMVYLLKKTKMEMKLIRKLTLSQRKNRKSKVIMTIIITKRAITNMAATKNTKKL